MFSAIDRSGKLSAKETMTDDHLELGTTVLVCRSREKNFLATEEAGVIVKLGCDYQINSDTDEKPTTKQDGIMVKLQISNTKLVFSPDQVSRLDTNSRSPSEFSQRRSRRAQVTPSPALSKQFHEGADDDEAKQKSKYFVGLTARKGVRGDDKGEEKKEDQSEKKSAGHAQKTILLRVQRSPSSSAKCLLCGEHISKGLLRLQPSQRKKGWYHVLCVGSAVPGPFANPSTFENFSDLTEGEKQLLETQLKESVCIMTKKQGSSDKHPDGKDDMEESDDDPPLSSLKIKVPTKKAKKAQTGKRKVKRKKTESDLEEKVKNEDNETDDDDPMLRASDTDSDDLRDMPFRAEYAASGRATCKGCDQRIEKGILRIAERPLFRGKPGFTVYRHLRCTVFGDQIECLQDVGGWRRLRKTDRDRVACRVEESKLLIEKENQELQPDELVQVNFQGEIRPNPPGLAANLLPFQVEGFSWMVHQEKHVPEIRGGILADEMGMGKTIQTITTMLDNRPKLQHAKPGAKHPPGAKDTEDRILEERLWGKSLQDWKYGMEKCNVPKKLLTQRAGRKGTPMGARAGTLVVCPVIALFQWKEEIEKFTDEKTFSICCYHGPNRAKEFPPDLLCKYDVVLTTYQVIEADFRKMVSPNKVKCPNCGGKFKIDKLRVHLKYFCGETAQRTEAQARQRRTANRHRGQNNNRNAGGGSGRGSKKKPALKSKSMTTKTMTKQNSEPRTNAKSQSKKTIRAKRVRGYDSDSDLSITEDVDLNSPRPRRSAAASASKRMAASSRQWGTTDSPSDTDVFSDNASSSSEEDSDTSKVPPMTKSARRTTKPGSSDDESSESDSEDEQALARARKKQRVALARARATKTKGGKKTPLPKKGKAPKTKKGKTPFPEDSSSESESSDEEIDESDPLKGIDLDELMREAMEGSRASVIHTMCWWRVVLDEAHMIKSRASQTAAAAFALTAINRWCLSGTPLQNRVGELYSLIRFLQIDPMAHYFCRKEGCDCKSVHYRMLNGRCQDCGCATIQHFSYFNKHVLNPIQRAGYQGDGRRAMMKLKTDVLDKSLLRRTKETRAEDMNLPPRVVTIRAIRLHPVEEDFYSALYTQTKSSFDDYVTEGTLLNNYAHIFDLLTKMRQAVDHPYMIVYSKKNAGKFSAPGTPAVANGTTDCELCHEPPTDRVVSSCCGSAFCRSCVIDFMSADLDDLQQGGTRCPCCRAPFSIDLNQTNSDIVDEGTLTLDMEGGKVTDGMPSLKEMSHVSSGSILRRINLAEFATSTKIEALVQELVEMRHQRPGSKALVFSQFVNMLDLVRWRLYSDPCLHDLGIGVRIIHGGMNVQSRDAALKDFREDTSVRVLLMSLKAGGVALNLTVANEVYLLDPWWNPAAEMQAIDRTHRLGQHRPIRAVRFIAEGTVEERVLQLQEKKRLVFDGTVGRDAASLKMLTVNDMKSLFT